MVAERGYGLAPADLAAEYREDARRGTRVSEVVGSAGVGLIAVVVVSGFARAPAPEPWVGWTGIALSFVSFLLRLAAVRVERERTSASHGAP